MLRKSMERSLRRYVPVRRARRCGASRRTAKASSRSSSSAASGKPSQFRDLAQVGALFVPAFSSMMTKTNSTMIAPAYTMICTAAMNSAPSSR
jgi:hypothetical protein